MTPRLFVLALLATGLAVDAAAQQDDGIEVFAGFAHQQGDFLSSSRNGWVASQTAYIRPWIGIEVEASGLYGRYGYLPAQDTPGAAGLDDDTMSVLAGPRFRVLESGWFALGAHALAGLTLSDSDVVFFSGGESTPAAAKLMSKDASAVFGSSLDGRISDRLAWRVQPDWQVRGLGERQGSLRISTGPVFRFGR